MLIASFTLLIVLSFPKISAISKGGAEDFFPVKETLKGQSKYPLSSDLSVLIFFASKVMIFSKFFEFKHPRISSSTNNN